MALSGEKFYESATLRRQGNVCMLGFRGLANLEGNSYNTLTALPAWATPSADVRFDVVTLDGLKYRVVVTSSGNLIAYNYQSDAEAKNYMGTLVWAVK